MVDYERAGMDEHFDIDLVVFGPPPLPEAISDAMEFLAIAWREITRLDGVI